MKIRELFKIQKQAEILTPQQQLNWILEEDSLLTPQQISEASSQAEILTHQLKTKLQQSKGNKVQVEHETLKELVAVLELFPSLLGSRYTEQIALRQAAQVDQAHTAYKKTNNFREAARILGWSNGKRGKDHNPVLWLHRYLDLIEKGYSIGENKEGKEPLTREEAVKKISQEYNDVSYHATLQKLKKARNFFLKDFEPKIRESNIPKDKQEEMINRYKKILPPNYPET